MFGIGLPEIIILLIIFLIIIPGIYYLLTLQKALSRCSKENRAMSPGLVWLLFIPIFGIVWHFFIVLNVSKSVKKELETRGVNIDSEPGQGVGVAMCILAILTIIPYVGLLIGVASIICWIIYWVKIAGFSSQLPSRSISDEVPLDNQNERLDMILAKLDK